WVSGNTALAECDVDARHWLIGSLWRVRGGYQFAPERPDPWRVFSLTLAQARDPGRPGLLELGAGGGRAGRWRHPHRVKTKDVVRRSILIGGAAIVAGGIVGGPAPAAGSAEETVASACAAAARDGKRVALVFFASWCSWCRLLDALLADPAAARIIDAHFS